MHTPLSGWTVLAAALIVAGCGTTPAPAPRGRAPKLDNMPVPEGAWQADRRHHARFVRGRDGNVVVLDVDRGGEVWTRDIPVRLAGTAAPAPTGLRQKQGERARDELIRRVREASHRGQLWIRVLQQDRFGRLVGLLYDGDLEINAQLIRDGLAEPFQGPYDALK